MEAPSPRTLSCSSSSSFSSSSSSSSSGVVRAALVLRNTSGLSGQATNASCKCLEGRVVARAHAAVIPRILTHTDRPRGTDGVRGKLGGGTLRPTHPHKHQHTHTQTHKRQSWPQGVSSSALRGCSGGAPRPTSLHGEERPLGYNPRNDSPLQSRWVWLYERESGVGGLGGRGGGQGCVYVCVCVCCRIRVCVCVCVCVFVKTKS
jgi:hypothetical protein